MTGKLYVVGIGPGDLTHMTQAARSAIETANVIAGYKTYLELIPELLEGKKILSTGMRREVERCRAALTEAAEGNCVALISSGDAGIYGMAGLVMELAGADPCVGLDQGEHTGSPLQDIDIEIVPGVSAVQAAAARLGAPLMHDFAVISLSDLLTSWTTIRRRLEAAAGADFVVALYNPRSKARTQQIREAREILLRHRAPGTPVGIVRNATRENETMTMSDLRRFTDEPIDMFSLVIVGNAATRIDSKGRMVTPRGYQVQETRGKEKGKAPNLEPLTLNLEPGPARALFVGGTGSDVGKSILTAGLCRIFKRRGLSVAPFKAQNMALNSAVTPEGGEIGRAQALQAAACELAPHTDMNPVLLKPNSEEGSQVILHGRPVGNMSIGEYHSYKTTAFLEVEKAFRRLAAQHDLVVLEGAGSIAEINLMDHDITNLRAAAMAGAPVLLVADIDRGGVFASIVGTIDLLDAAQRSRIAGVIINRFRGDASLLKPGIEEVERRTGVPVLGVVPWIDLRLPEEDSVALDRKRAAPGGAIHIGVVRLPRISNYTDFDALERETAVSIHYVTDPAEIEGLDLLILPGTKNTLADLDWIFEKGFDAAIGRYHQTGGRIIGICGGFQMLGSRIDDPGSLESPRRQAKALGLLDVTTAMQPDKQTHQAEGTLLGSTADCGLIPDTVIEGYEIHMGETRRGAYARAFSALSRTSGENARVEDGAVSTDGRVWGTYLHGLFDNVGFCRQLLATLDSRFADPDSTEPLFNLQEELDRLADHLEKHLDLDCIEKMLDLSATEDKAWTG
ncbi:MAG: cobyric acid synthase [Desulfuromonadales bacterium]